MPVGNQHTFGGAGEGDLDDYKAVKIKSSMKRVALPHQFITTSARYSTAGLPPSAAMTTLHCHNELA